MKKTKKKVNKNIFGRNFKKLFLLVVAVIIVVGIAQYTVQFIPGSSAQIPLPSPYAALGKEFRVTTDGGELPDIYGDNVVFVRDGKIFLRNLNTNSFQDFMVSKDPAFKWEPAIYQDKIVWVDARYRTTTHSNDIYMYNMTMKTETRITSDAIGYDYNMTPDIYGNKIIWIGGNDNEVVKLFMYNIDTKIISIISAPEARPFAPTIYGERIIWHDERNPWPDFSLCIYDIETGVTSVVDNTGLFILGGATIYKDMIAWGTEVSQASWWIKNNIYSYDINTQTRTRLTDVSDHTYAFNPAIYGNKIVWWYTTPTNDPSTYKISIYIHYFDQPVGRNYKIVDIPVTGDVLDSEGSLEIYDKTIVWADKRDIFADGKINIFAFKLFR